MKRLLSLLLCLLLLLGLTACGSNTSATMKAESAPMARNAAMAGGAPMEDAMVESSAAGKSGSLSSAPLPENRKWIITVYMDAETEELEEAISAIDAHIREIGGYVEDQSIYNGSAYESRRYRSASLTIRIPAQQVDAFTATVGSIANVVRTEKNLEDITLTYTATESRVKALETEQDRLLELLSEAETMSDLLEIEARLSDVRYELEQVTSQLRLYNNQIDYATIYFNLSEVQEYTPVEEPTFWERIRDGFADSIEGLWEGAVDVLVWFLVNIPYLAVFALLAVLIRRILKRLPKRKPKE